MVDIKPDIEITTQALGEKLPSGTPLPTRELQLVQKTQQIMQEQGEMSAVESMKVIGVGEEQVKMATVRNVTEDAERTKPGGGGKEKLRDVADRAGLLTEKFLKGGFDSITDPSEKALMRVQLEKSLTRLWPEAQKHFADMKARDPRAFAAHLESILKDPKYAGVVQEVMKNVVDAEGKLPVIPQELREKLADFDGKIQVNRREYTNAKIAQKKAAEDMKREFGIDRKTGTKAPSLDELDTLVKTEETERVEKQTIEHDLVTLRADFQKKQHDWDLVVSGKAKTPDPDAVKQAMEKAHDAVADAEKRKVVIEQHEARLKQLRDRKSQLENEEARLEGEMERLDDEKLVLEQQKADVQSDVDLITLERTHHQDAYVRSLEEAFQTAGVQYFEGRYEDAEKAQLKVLEDEKEKAATDDEKKVYDNLLMKRWKSVRTGSFNREKVVPNKENIQADMQILLQQGPEALMNNMGITDPELQKKVQTAVVRTLLQEKLRTGGFKQGEAEYVFNSRWGEGLLAEAMQRNEALQAQMNQLKEAGVLKNATHTGLIEFAKNNPWVRSTLLGLVLAGVGLAPTMGLLTGAAGLIAPRAGSPVGAGASVLGSIAGMVR